MAASTVTVTPKKKSIFSGFSSLSKNLTARKASSAQKKSLSDSGLVQVASTNLYTYTGTEYVKLSNHLTTYHESSHLLVDVGGVLADNNCPKELFTQSRLEFPDSESLETMVAICTAMQRWWLADERNIVVLCADSDLIHRIAACTLNYNGRYNTAFEALHAYHLATHNRIMAEVLKRRVPPSEKRFLHDFTTVITADKVLHVPSLILKELIIHKLPSYDETGCRLMVMILQQTNFLYDSMRTAGGAIWIPTSPKDPLTISLPINVEIKGEGHIRAYHRPEEMNTNVPRIPIFNITFHTAVAAVKSQGLRVIYTRQEMDQSADDRGYHDKFRIELVFALPLKRPNDSIDGKSDEKSSAPTPLPAAPATGSTTPPRDPAAPPPLVDMSPKVIVERGKVTETMDLSTVTNAILQRAMSASSGSLSSTTSPSLWRSRSATAYHSHHAVHHSPQSAFEQQMIAAGLQPAPLPALSRSYSGVGVGANGSPLLSPSAGGVAAVSPLSLETKSAGSTDSKSSGASTPSRLSGTTTTVTTITSTTTFDLTGSPNNSSGAGSTSIAGATTPVSSAAAAITPVRIPSSRSSGTVNAGGAIVTRSPNVGSAAAERHYHQHHAVSVADTSLLDAIAASIADEEARVARVAAQQAAASGSNGSASASSTTPSTSSSENVLLDLFGVSPSSSSSSALTTAVSSTSSSSASSLSPTSPTSSTLSSSAPIAMSRMEDIDLQLARALQAKYDADAHARARRERRRQREARERERLRAHGLLPPAAASASSSPNSASAAAASPAVSPAAAVASSSGVITSSSSPVSSPSSSSSAHRSSHRSSSSRSSHRHSSSRPTVVTTAAAGVSTSTSLSPLPLPSPSSPSSPLSPTMATAPSSSSAASLSVPSPAIEIKVPASGATPDLPAATATTLPAAPVSPATASTIIAAASQPSPGSRRRRAEDEELARRLQAEYEAEIRQQQQHGMSAMLRAQGALDVDSLSYEDVQSLQEYMGISADNARRLGASSRQIRMLPEFKCPADSKYLSEECQVCKETFVVGDIMRSLPCFHAYHKDCVDTWLRLNKSCPICNRKIDAAV